LRIRFYVIRFLRRTNTYHGVLRLYDRSRRFVDEGYGRASPALELRRRITLRTRPDPPEPIPRTDPLPDMSPFPRALCVPD
jgi:hypothetical protein